MKRKSVTHSLKTWPEYYDAAASGAKPFEVRKDDRDFQVGDTLLLRKYVPEQAFSQPKIAGYYTGAFIKRKITYILDGVSWKQEDGFCVLGLGKVKKKKS